MTSRDGPESLPAKGDHPEVVREWRFERGGWIIIALLLALGLAGAFGGGPLSHATVRGGGDALVVQYERIARHSAPITMIVDIAGAPDSIARLTLDRQFLEGLEVDAIVPQPIETRSTSTHVEFQFRRDSPNTSLHVVVGLTPVTIGVRRTAVSTDAASVALTQVVLP